MNILQNSTLTTCLFSHTHTHTQTLTHKLHFSYGKSALPLKKTFFSQLLELRHLLGQLIKNAHLGVELK